MKTLLRYFFYSLFALWATTLIIKTFQVKGDISSFLYTAGILGALNLLVKPILKLILFPVNLLTFGLFSWIINVAILYLLTRLTPYISITPWVFPGISTAGFVVPAVNLSYTWTLIAVSLVITAIVTVLGSINEE